MLPTIPHTYELIPRITITSVTHGSLFMLAYSSRTDKVWIPAVSIPKITGGVLIGYIMCSRFASNNRRHTIPIFPI